MRDLAMHILDIAGNSIRAKATLIEVYVQENLDEDRMLMRIRDDGSGMDEKTLQRAVDPFFTSRKTRKVGLGIPLLKQNTEVAEGQLNITSEPGKGTFLEASFMYSHIDRIPLGDIPGTITLLVCGNPQVDFIYHHIYNDEEYIFDSREVKEILEDVAVNDPKVIKFIKQMVEENLQEIGVEL